MSQELKDRALEAAAKRALYVEPHLEVWLSEDDFQHIFQQAFEAYDKVMATAPAPAEREPVAWLRHGEKVPVQNVPFGAMWITDQNDPRGFPVYAEPPALQNMTGAIAAIAAERQRQVAKGYDMAHDDEHKGGEIVLADWGARARIEAAINAGHAGDSPAYKELLTEAAAQCVAEIERVERAEGKANG
jgi:hypothetical protein